VIRLSLIVDPEQANTVKQLMKQKIPSAKIVDESGGSLMYSVPSTQPKQLQDFFRFILSSKTFINKSIEFLKIRMMMMSLIN